MSPDSGRVEAVVERILEDYRHGRDIDKIDQFRQPDKEAVIDVIAKLRRIVFPGYVREKNYRIYNAKYNLSMLVEDVMFNLSRQISLALQSTGLESAEAENRGKELCLSFLHKIPEVRAVIQTDLEAAYDGDPAATGYPEVIFSYPGLFAVVVYRLAHELWELEVPLLPRMMTEYAHGVTGIDIHPGAKIGPYFFIDHGTGVVIGETTVVGHHVKLYQGVTLGALTTKGGQKLRGCRRHPTIEDNVTIYAGASILGGDTVIGAGSVVGSNVFITSSLAAGTTVSTRDQPLNIKQH